ncbi:TonB-dependent receptor [Paucihalobacter ruber]|uniref:TonB-dependent receptor n=1 Tax=Paucihalobacter ruber TaxID=2567861 RepID=A0A506PK92_9FLAO|nr:TonB-dependent receptor plug domain-containing protein [Paucihalobacter ruber]TPV33775.1 TonB-dependent receptor [Paucihalobacter ruber]
MKRMLIAAWLCAGISAYAQDLNQQQSLDSVFIDSKTLLPRKNSGKVVTKITSEVLERSTGKTLAQVINEFSGMEINGSRSNDGQNLGYFARGGRNRQVVIVIDGVQVNDPSQIANDFDLRLLSVQNIEQIEIVKGASSVLYGSGASTAVISITSKKSSEKPISGNFSTMIGSNKPQDVGNFNAEQFVNNAQVGGSLGKWFYEVSFQNRFTDGLSAVAAPDGEAQFESDVFNAFNVNAKLGYRFSENLKISRFFALDQFKSGFDNFDFTDADNLSESKQRRIGGNLQWQFKNSKFVFNDSYTRVERGITSAFPSKFDSEFFAFDTYFQHQFNTSISATLGLNLTNSKMNSFSIPFGGTDFEPSIQEDDANFTIVDPYLNVLYISDFGLNVNAGARLNTHSVYENKVVYNINPSYNFKLKENNLKLLSSYSTAYITPSLFQIFDPSFGNEDLLPEENRTIEAGLEFTNSKSLRVSVVYFNREEKNFVDFVTLNPDLFISQYQNIADLFTSSGVEVEFSNRFGNKIQLNANYTFTDADTRFALRIPKHKVNASLLYMPSQKTTLSLAYQFNDSREDQFFNPSTFASERVTLSSFGITDFYVSHQLNNHVKFMFNLTNIFDQDYQEIFRFSTRGRNALVGLQLSF